MSSQAELNSLKTSITNQQRAKTQKETEAKRLAGDVLREEREFASLQKKLDQKTKEMEQAKADVEKEKQKHDTKVAEKAKVDAELGAVVQGLSSAEKQVTEIAQQLEFDAKKK